MGTAKYRSATFGMDAGDIAVANGRFVIASGKDCYLTQIHTLVKTLKGEILLAPSVGIPYFDTVFNIENQNGIYAWASRVRDAVMKLDFVLSIEKFEYGASSDMTLRYSLVVKTDDGLVEDTESGLGVSKRNDSDTPTIVTPLAGSTFRIDTDESLASTTHKVASEIGVQDISTETLGDQFESTKKIVKSLGGDTVDFVGNVEYNDSNLPTKPLDGKTLPLETDEDVRDDTKTIIEILGGKVT